ncbi:MAG: RhuM family protein [Rhodomicrobium sp.]
MSVTATKELEPLSLFEDDTGAQFLIYNTDRGVQTELRFEQDNPWFTQSQLAQIFGVSVPTVNEHIAKFLADGELDDSVIRKFRITAKDGKLYNVQHYALDVAFYVGYRVNSKQGILFRRWATQVLLQYAIKGFVVHKERLKDPEDYGRIQELRRIIAEIRASDVNFYGELRQICAMAKDYDAKSPAWHSFYKQMRAKLYWAVVSRTPSMLMAERADADAPKMGLQSWAGDRILQKDATSAVRYLAEAEYRELNTLTVILLDVFSDQADLGKLTSMQGAEELFEKQLTLLNRSVLKHGGSISSEEAEEHAKAEYKKFDTKRKAESFGIEVQAYLELKAQGKSLPKAKRKKKSS